MKKLSDEIYASLSSIPGADADEMRKAARAEQVRKVWSELVEKPMLDHTNGVYVFSDGARRQMHVYMDESIYAAELNNRRELLKLRFHEKTGDEIDDFLIHISKGKYKNVHPFKRNRSSQDADAVPVPLSGEEIKRVERSCAGIADERLREHFKKAMIRDLEWKKGTDNKNIQNS